jgi:hypothetical protein
VSSFQLDGYCIREVNRHLRVRGALDPTLEYDTWSISESINIMHLSTAVSKRYHYGSRDMEAHDGLGYEHLANMETLVKTHSGVQCDLDKTL